MVFAKKKPIVIEATQWNKFGDHLEVIKYWDSISPGFRPSSGGDIVDDEILCKKCNIKLGSHGWVDTLEGGHIVCPTDWIIKGAHGELYPIKDLIFKETYDAVDEFGMVLPWSAV